MPYQPMLFRTTYINYLTTLPEKRSDKMLWVSDLGMHPYNAMNRILHSHREAFPPKIVSKMEDGNALEDHSVAIWSRALPLSLHTDVPLYSNCWSGYADAIFDLGSSNPIILEHKTTTVDGWRHDKTRGPVKVFHACQVWLYGQLFYERYSVRATTVLFYRSMDDRWGEFLVQTNADEHLTLTGHLDGEAMSFTSRTNPRALRDELEYYYYNNRQLPEPPPGQTWDYAGKFERV